MLCQALSRTQKRWTDYHKKTGSIVYIGRQIVESHKHEQSWEHVSSREKTKQERVDKMRNVLKLYKTCLS